jgi:uncharacterized protein (TIGR02598 family)
MAIGIIAIAFVALLGLLPVGLNTYRAAMDEANETWIMQSMNFHGSDDGFRPNQGT